MQGRLAFDIRPSDDIAIYTFTFALNYDIFNLDWNCI